MQVAERSVTPETVSEESKRLAGMPEKLKRIAALNEEDHQLHIPRIRESMTTLIWEHAVRRGRAEIRSIEREIAEGLGWRSHTAQAAESPGFYERNMSALREMLALFDGHGMRSRFVFQRGLDFSVDLVEKT